ncbi:MAG TPA: phage minor tail protein G [Buttiauxella sp.]|jgi:phage minor tail protein G
MPYLKSEQSVFYPDIQLTELSGLQRIHYLEYIAEEEKRLAVPDGEEPALAAVMSMNFRLSARLVALSLFQRESGEVDLLDDHAIHAAVGVIQRRVLMQWSYEGIAANALQIRKLSGMLPPVPESETDDRVTEPADNEPLSAEKP